jgi:hypothetical protein
MMRDSTVLVREVSSAWRVESSCSCFLTMEAKMLCWVERFIKMCLISLIFFH